MVSNISFSFCRKFTALSLSSVRLFLPSFLRSKVLDHHHSASGPVPADQQQQDDGQVGHGDRLEAVHPQLGAQHFMFSEF